MARVPKLVGESGPARLLANCGSVGPPHDHDSRAIVRDWIRACLMLFCWLNFGVFAAIFGGHLNILVLSTGRSIQPKLVKVLGSGTGTDEVSA